MQGLENYVPYLVIFISSLLNCLFSIFTYRKTGIISNSFPSNEKTNVSTKISKKDQEKLDFKNEIVTEILNLLNDKMENK